MSNTNIKHKTKLPLPVLLTYLIVVTLVATGVSLSAYVTTASGEDSVRVAVMANNVTMNLPVSELAPGEAKSIEVSVSNKDSNERVCEVAQSYTIKVESLLERNGIATDNIPLEWKFYLDEECTEEVNTGNCIEGSFPAGIEAMHQYWVNVYWPEGANAEQYAFEVDALQLIIRAEQID